MPTQSERQALLFLASVALLGVGWRTVRANAAPDPTAEEREALAGQIAVVDSVRAAGHRKGARASSRKAAESDAPVNVNQATAEELEALPRIGPALAARIVAYRDSAGAFGSMDALERVRGIGPSMAKALASRVTFSTSRRPTDAATDRPLVLPAQWSSAAPRKHRQ